MNQMATPQGPVITSPTLHGFMTRGEIPVSDPPETAKCLIVDRAPGQRSRRWHPRCRGRTARSSRPPRPRRRWISRANTTSPSCCSTSQIPTLDGHTLAELMRGAERSSATPIVFMTSARPARPIAHVSRLRGGGGRRAVQAREPRDPRAEGQAVLRTVSTEAGTGARAAGARGRPGHRLARHAHAACPWCTPPHRCCSIPSTSSRRSRCANSTNASSAMSIS